MEDTNGRIRTASVSSVVTITVILLAMLLGMPRTGAAFSDQHAMLLPFQFPAPFPSPGRLRPETELARGKFLVASRQLGDPNFSETVVLLLEYGWNGAMGVIINRPTEVKLSTVFPQIKEVQQRTDTVYLGGPIARNQMLLLVRSDSPPDESQRVFTDVYVSSSWTVFRRIIADTGKRLRVYAGYAGWAPGQLDHEVARGDWHVVPADAETVFEKAPAEIWPELIQRGSMEWVKVWEPTQGTLIYGMYPHSERTARVLHRRRASRIDVSVQLQDGSAELRIRR